MKLALNWGWRIAAVYTLFALATLGFVAFAMTQRVDLVRTDYYEQSLRHDERVRSEANARSLGSDASLAVKGDVLTIRVPQHHIDATGTIWFYRPDDPSADRVYSLDLSVSTAISMPLSDLRKGVWHITVDWKVKNDAFRLDTVITR